MGRHTRLDLTVNFHHEHFIDPTNCPWVSEDDFSDTRSLINDDTLVISFINSILIPTIVAYFNL